MPDDLRKPPHSGPRSTETTETSSAHEGEAETTAVDGVSPLADKPGRPRRPDPTLGDKGYAGHRNRREPAGVASRR